MRSFRITGTLRTQRGAIYILHCFRSADLPAGDAAKEVVAKQILVVMRSRCADPQAEWASDVLIEEDDDLLAQA